MKKISIIFAAVIIALILILILVPRPSSAPAVPAGQSGNGTSGGGSQLQAQVSSDGHLVVELPRANDIVVSPMAIEGNVVGGGWFFEASFPIKVLNAKGDVIGRGTAQALSNWMSTGTVPFAASIAFTAPHTATGTLVFSADNPSGLPANEKSFSVPVTFQTP